MPHRAARLAYLALAGVFLLALAGTVYQHWGVALSAKGMAYYRDLHK